MEEAASSGSVGSGSIGSGDDGFSCAGLEAVGWDGDCRGTGLALGSDAASRLRLLAIASTIGFVGLFASSFNQSSSSFSTLTSPGTRIDVVHFGQASFWPASDDGARNFLAQAGHEKLR